MYKDFSTNPESNKNRRIIWILIAIVAVLVGLLIYQQFATSNAIHEKEETFSQNLNLKSELDNLMSEYNTIKEENAQYSEQLTERDSLIKANANEIQKLIASQADYRKIKRKLELLRGITQDYVARIDSLIIVNDSLTTENTEIKEQVKVEKKKNTELSKSNQELNRTVSTAASTFKAYNLRATTVRIKSKGQESETDKASRVDAINVCFTLSENKIAASGSLPVYVRIARPDGVIMVESNSDAYSFTVDTTVLQFSLKKDLDYKNVAQEVCLKWMKKDKDADAMKGSYNVAVFTAGKEIGRTSFELK